MVAAADTGAWSLYSWAGREATLGYHQLIAGFLGDMCARTQRARRTARARERFSRYEREPTRIGIAPLTGLRARHATTVRFSISKVSAVKVRVCGRRGVAFSRDLELAYGAHQIAWTPPARGRFRLRDRGAGAERAGRDRGAPHRCSPSPPKPKKAKKPKRPEPGDVLTGRTERDKVSR